ncbi:MAG TPA: GMC family oxidoreductase, partial [Pilimelia sp.]|nr:GMC family oxidoreductase [Pilimelia sp.]
AGHAEPARPEPPLVCVPAAQWPARAPADAVVVGSGAGGAMAGREVARAGLRVVICEEGRRFTVADFRDRPIVDRFTALYRDGGATVALGLPPILLPLGRGVGGTTLVNSGTCYRTPDRVLRRWRDRFGVPAADPDRFGHLLDEVERTLAVAPTPVEILGRNGLLALAGAQRLGWRAAPLRRNAPGCGGCCECVVGCPRNAKYGVHLNALPQACAAGAVIVTGARVDRVLVDRAPGGRARAAGVAFGGHEILAPLVVVAAGAVETPRLLRRSGLGRHPALGRGLAVHPATSVAGRFDEPVVATRGVLQGVGIEQLHDDGILIEATAGPPGLASFVLPGVGRALRTELDRADHLAFLGAMVADGPAGRVGDRTVNYRLAPADADRLRRSMLAMGRVLFAAGAREVLTGVARRPYARSPEELADIAASTRATELHLAAFHPTGTARLGADPRLAPVDPTGRVRGARGVYVADASVLPSCPQVNPQLSVMAMALAVASAILDGRTQDRRPARVPTAARFRPSSHRP